MYDPLPVTDDQVTAWRGLIDYHASRYAKLNRDLAEEDDLVQAGMIRVWLNLRHGKPVSEVAIKNAMRDELRRVGTPGTDRATFLDDLDSEYLALDGVGL